MRKSLLRLVRTVLLCAALIFSMGTPVFAQDSEDTHEDNTPEASVADLSKYSTSWKLIPPLGLREQTPMDTLMLNYYTNAVPSLVSPAWITTGNLGAEGMNMIFDDRAPMSNFFFRDALLHWIPTAEKMRFYNTRIPVTFVSFNSSGGRDNAQERLKATFSGNINAKAGVGAKLDYLYSKGSYENQATKDLSWGLFGYYLGDRYECQAYFDHYNFVNKENGGITDMLYITDPAELQGGISSINPKSIPTNLNSAHTRLMGDELYVNNRYKVGYWHEEKEGDSIISREYIPVSSFIHTLRYNSNWHLFVDNNEAEVAKYFGRKYLNPDKTYDNTSFWSLTNTVGLSLLEGFHKYAKFGLAAYATHQVRRYTLPADSLDRLDPANDLTPLPAGIENIQHARTQNLMWIGAQLTKQKGSLLRYEATAQLGLVGPVAGDVDVKGRLSTRFPMLKDSLILTAFAEFRNEEAPYLTQNYISNHFAWYNEFGKQRTVNFGGELNLGRTDTHFRASFSNLQNYIYFGADGLPYQNGGSVQVLSLSLQQNISAGILHWDNRLNYQTTSNAAVVPLPAFSVYSNLYILFKIATLHVQLGVDCDYYTRYYSPIYNPATATFANQQDIKVGNFPFCNVYANMKLSKARFYVMYSHANRGLFGGNDYFSMPYYPLNPARLQIGVAVDFVN